MICVLIATGFEEIEALAFTDILRRTGLDTVLVTIDNNGIVFGSHNIGIISDCKISDVDYDKVEAVVLPGGLPGSENLYKSQKVRDLLKFAVNNKLPVGAICASPYIVLEQLGYLKGVKATVNPAFYKNMTNAELVKQNVVSDKNFITSQGPGTTAEFAKTFVSLFKSQQIADELIAEMLFE